MVELQVIFLGGGGVDPEGRIIFWGECYVRWQRITVVALVGKFEIGALGNIWGRGKEIYETSMVVSRGVGVGRKIERITAGWKCDWEYWKEEIRSTGIYRNDRIIDEY